MTEQARISSPAHSPLPVAETPAAATGSELLYDVIQQPAIMQCKRSVGTVDDPLEAEAGAMADQVMRMPVNMPQQGVHETTIQRRCADCEEEAVQRKPLTSFIQKKGNDDTATASANVTSRINSTKGGGSGMDAATKSFMESRFATDFSGVKIHTGDYAVQLSRDLGAQAFTVGSDIYFNDGKYDPVSDSGKHLLAHELTHTVQQGATPQVSPEAIQRKVLQTKKMDQLRTLLDDDNGSAAIALMATLDEEEKNAVLNRRDYKELAIDAFGNESMYQAMKAMRINLYKSLEWMFDEGTEWEYVRDIIKLIKEGRDLVIADSWMQKQFTGVCGNKDMAEAVDLLEGTLIQKLTWMEDEGSNWALVREKIRKTVSAEEKTALYGSSKMLSFFTSICDNEEMAEAVDLIGGTLLQKLAWMEDEGTDWGLVRNVIKKTKSRKEKDDLYANAHMRSYFTGICNDEQMTEAVTLLGGALNDKLRWLVAEDVSAKYYFEVISNTPAAELTGVTKDNRDLIKSSLSKENYDRVIQMLDNGLLKWGTDEQDYKEKLYEKKPDGSRYKKTYDGHGYYDIEYSRTAVKIIVRTKLKGEPVPIATQNIWKAGIQNRWKDKFHLEGPRRLDIIFVPIFTNDNPHHTLNVKNEPGMREDAGNWELNTNGDTAAHEFGHWIGNPDEYWRSAEDFQAIVGRAPTAAEKDGPESYTSSDPIMSSGAGDAQIRHFGNILKWLNKNRLRGEAPYRLVAGP